MSEKLSKVVLREPDSGVPEWVWSEGLAPSRTSKSYAATYDVLRRIQANARNRRKRLRKQLARRKGPAQSRRS